MTDNGDLTTIDSESAWFFAEQLHPRSKSRLFRPLLSNNNVLTPSAYSAAPVVMQAEVIANQQKMAAAFRLLGHKAAHINPMGTSLPQVPELQPSAFGLESAAVSKSLKDYFQFLQQTYCGNLGVEFMHLADDQARDFVCNYMEQQTSTRKFSSQEQTAILKALTDAESFETFVHRKFLGAKRFSLEGGESTLPALQRLLAMSAQENIDLVVLGMAHRGRLNTLANLLQKPGRIIFNEFADRDDVSRPGKGDVKYHLGYDAHLTEQLPRPIDVSLCYNPSHLEFVNPVVAGRVRAQQDQRQDSARKRVLGVMIHGDASVIGQGVVAETLNLSGLAGYSTGGTLHLIINNQIGFTTVPQEAKSGLYSSDVAKMLDIPIVHVNGDAPEQVIAALELVFAYQRRFGKDVVLDIVCYRRWGHNEGDEPAFTQPVMSQWIKQRQTVRTLYAETVGQAVATQLLQAAEAHWEAELAQAAPAPSKTTLDNGVAAAVEKTPLVAEAMLERLQAAQNWPSSFAPHPKVEKLYEQRLEMARGSRPYDWGAAEMQSYASLLTENIRVRLSGQDSRRGTFSHRHAALSDYQTGAAYLPLAHLAEHFNGQVKVAPIEVINSPLSETAVMGFDYGYSLEAARSLILWEAQFGDFANGAQVIIDQFLVSAQQKWHQHASLALLLPHGYEGQGPEHSSARIERFLAAAVADNMTVVQPTTPAQIFHVLRRHAYQTVTRPLVVFTPKSLLRHPEAVSPRSFLSTGQFAEILVDVKPQVLRTAKRVVLCSGKVYYDALALLRSSKTTDVVLLRIEQLHPFPLDSLLAILADYPPGQDVVWLQDEPLNMGAWPYFHLYYRETIAARWRCRCVSRQPSSSPATGSLARHQYEQKQLLQQALT